MEVNFSDTVPSTPAVDVAATTTPAAPVAEQPAPAPTPAPEAGSQVPATTSGILLGDKLPEFKDIILPRVNLTQNIGKMTESFENGTLVYNQQIPLFVPGKVNTQTATLERPATKPVIMTVMGFKPTRFYEKVKWGGDQAARGVVVDSEAAVRSAGGTLDYNEWKLKEKAGMKRFEPGVDCMVAIERPETAKDNTTDFTFEVEGKFYTLAMWNLRGSLYTAAAKRVFFTARLIGCLKQAGYPSWNYAVTTREENWTGGVSSWIPVCLPNQKNTPEFLKFVQSVLG